MEVSEEGLRRAVAEASERFLALVAQVPEDPDHARRIRLEVEGIRDQDMPRLMTRLIPFLKAPPETPPQPSTAPEAPSERVPLPQTTDQPLRPVPEEPSETSLRPPVPEEPQPCPRPSESQVQARSPPQGLGRGWHRSAMFKPRTYTGDDASDSSSSPVKACLSGSALRHGLPETLLHLRPAPASPQSPDKTVSAPPVPEPPVTQVSSLAQSTEVSSAALSAVGEEPEKAEAEAAGDGDGSSQGLEEVEPAESQSAVWGNGFRAASNVPSEESRVRSEDDDATPERSYTPSASLSDESGTSRQSLQPDQPQTEQGEEPTPEAQPQLCPGTTSIVEAPSQIGFGFGGGCPVSQSSQSQPSPASVASRPKPAPPAERRDEAKSTPKVKVVIDGFGGGFAGTDAVVRSLQPYVVDDEVSSGGTRHDPEVMGPVGAATASAALSSQEPSESQPPEEVPDSNAAYVEGWMGRADFDPAAAVDEDDLHPTEELAGLGIGYRPALTVFGEWETRTCRLLSVRSPVEISVVPKCLFQRKRELEEELRSPGTSDLALPAFSDASPRLPRRYPLLVKRSFFAPAWERAELVEKVRGAAFLRVRMVDEGTEAVVSLALVASVPRHLLRTPGLAVEVGLAGLRSVRLSGEEMSGFFAWLGEPGTRLLVKGAGCSARGPGTTQLVFLMLPALPNEVERIRPMGFAARPALRCRNSYLDLPPQLPSWFLRRRHRDLQQQDTNLRAGKLP